MPAGLQIAGPVVSQIIIENHSAIGRAVVAYIIDVKYLASSINIIDLATFLTFQFEFARKRQKKNERIGCGGIRYDNLRSNSVFFFFVSVFILFFIRFGMDWKKCERYNIISCIFCNLAHRGTAHRTLHSVQTNDDKTKTRKNKRNWWAQRERFQYVRFKIIVKLHVNQTKYLRNKNRRRKKSIEIKDWLRKYVVPQRMSDVWFFWFSTTKTICIKKRDIHGISSDCRKLKIFQIKFDWFVICNELILFCFERRKNRTKRSSNFQQQLNKEKKKRAKEHIQYPLAMNNRTQSKKSTESHTHN